MHTSRVCSGWLILTLLVGTPAAAQPIEVSRTPYPSALMDRAGAAMRSGDYSAARRLYGVAAAQGVAQAATEMGKTYDPAVLGRAGATLTPDPGLAAHWYEKAGDLGDPLAADLLRTLKAKK